MMYVVDDKAPCANQIAIAIIKVLLNEEIMWKTHVIAMRITKYQLLLSKNKTSLIIKKTIASSVQNCLVVMQLQNQN